MNHPYSYSEVPYPGSEVKEEAGDVTSNLSVPGTYPTSADPPSLPSIASLLSEGQSNGEPAKQGAAAHASNQSTPRIPQPTTQPAEAVTPQAVSGPHGPQGPQGPHGPHGAQQISGKAMRSHVRVSPSLASQQGPGSPSVHQGVPPHTHQAAPLPPQSMSRVPPHMHQQMQRSVNASPRSNNMEHPHQPTRSPAAYVMQQQMGNSPQGSGYMMPQVPSQVASQVASQAQGPQSAGAQSPHGQVPPNNMVNSGHPYMMQNQYWQKAPMHPMYPVMSTPGMQPMAPVMQYYPTTGPYRAGHRNLSMGQEIKRRTKTGCLTCRRRRIKCDEQHPMCKNCSKSERICLGYDPILMSFSNDKNARLKQLQIKRRRFAQRQKYEKMRVASLVESTPPDTPHTWEQVVELFRYITPQLDELFETRQFSAIAQHVSQQLKHQGESKIVGELEVIRQLVTIVFSDRNFDGLNVLDFPGANLEKLRTTNDYTLVRCLVEALTLPDSSLHAAQIADERIQGKVMLMKQVIFAKEIHTASPVSAAEIVHSAVNAVSNPQQSWITISDLLTRGGQEIQVPPQVGPLGTLVIASAGEHSAQQLLQQNLDPFSRALLELSLDPP